MKITDEELIEKVNEASRVENERQEKRKRATVVKCPKVQELSSNVQNDPARSSITSKPKEPNTSGTIKAVKSKDSKAEQTISMGYRSQVGKQRLKGCRECASMRHAVHLILTKSPT